jgi:pentatricopeptide repeat protein
VLDALLAACAMSGDLERACRLHERIVARHGATPAPSRSHGSPGTARQGSPGTALGAGLGALIEALCEHGRVRDAVALWAEQAARGLRLPNRVLVKLVEACADPIAGLTHLTADAAASVVRARARSGTLLMSTDEH